LAASDSPAPAPPPRQRAGRAWLLPLALLAIAAYANALHGEFLYDDYPYIVENPQVQQPTFTGIFAAPLARGRQLALYRPLPLLTYAAQARGRGADAPTGPFHALNVALHAGVTLLVFALALRLTVAPVVAALGAAIFAVHPIHLEAVDWIVGRAELMAALFGLAYVVLSLDANELRSRGRRAAAYGCFVLACLCKESAFVLPGVVVTLGWMRGERPRVVDLVRRHAFEACVLALLVAARIAVIGHFAPVASLGPYGQRPWYARLGIAANLLGAYSLRAIVPLPPRIFFHRAEFSHFNAASLAGLALFASAFLVFRRRRGVRAALAAFPVALLTVLNLLPIQETLAERFLYLPSALICVALGAVLGAPIVTELARRGRVGRSLLLPVATVAALLGACWFWNPMFDDALSLWRHNVAQAPDLPFPHYQSGYFLFEKQIWTGRDAAESGAREEFETALRKNDALLARGEEGMPPDQLARAWLNVGDICLERVPESRRDYEKARVALLHVIEVGRATKELDPEYGRALFLYAQLRHVKPGITRQEARAALDETSPLRLSPELTAAIREDRARIDAEGKGDQ